jgi:hypothetical protein
MIMQYTGKVVLDYRRGVVEADHVHDTSLVKEGDYEPYKCYDEICINDYHEIKSWKPLQSYTRGLSTKEKDGIRSTDAQAGSEESRRWLARQDRSYADIVPNSLSGKKRHIVQELTEHQLLLLHPETLVYGLKRKQWSKYSPAFWIFLD